MGSSVEDTTIRPAASATRVGSAVPATLHLTILWHPAPSRVGQIAVLDTRLSRLEPEFGNAPLEVAHVSRTPAVFRRVSSGLQIDAPAIVELIVDGRTCTGSSVVDDAALARGVVLELAGRVVLLLHLRRPSSADPIADDLLGGSDVIAGLRSEIARVADLEVPVLVTGETGSGKEHVARALHRGSARATGPFVAVNMATLSPGTCAAQLFGHVKGAFTGADRAHAGFFEQAHGGTLFLDEVGDAPEHAQAMLLRVLETREIQPVGAETTRVVDVRVIAASDAELRSDPEFRPQLYHRLAGYTLGVPPLRARIDDLGVLLVAFLARELTAAGAAERLTSMDPTGPPWLPSAALRAFARHRWPGNVRELANVARHLAIAGRHGPIAIEDALAPLGLQATAEPIAGAPREITDDVLVAALASQRWKIGATATALGISRTTLYALMERCPQLRKARELTHDEIVASRDQAAGDLDQMAEALRVSRRGLQLRMRELGL